MRARLPIAPLLAASLLIVTTAHAQWTWLYPRPQGHHLYDVEYLTDTVAVAVGEAATVMVTNDGGDTWFVSSQTNGLTGILRSVAAIDANTAVAVGDGGVVLRTVDAGLNWSPQFTGTTENLGRVDFVGSLGIAVGSNGTWRSVDGGQSWTAVPLGYAVYDVDVVSSTLAFAAVFPGVLKSTDGGQTWVDAGFPEWLWQDARIAFADELNGVVSSPLGGFDTGTYYLTTDGGQSWLPYYGPLLGSHMSTSPTEMIVVDAQTWFIAASGGGCDPTYNCISFGSLFRTEDGAASWDATGAPRPLLGLDRNSAGTVLAVGEGGNIWRWTPPATWQQFGGTQYDQYDASSAISFAGPSTGIVTGLNFIPGGGPTETLTLRTSDAGSSWSGSFAYAIVNDVSHARGVDPAVYGVGVTSINGVRHTGIFKSTDNGATWPLIWSEAPYTWLWAIEFASATHGVAVGDNGRFAVIDNDLVTTGTIAGAGKLAGVAFAEASVAVAIGADGLFRTTDGGATWSNVPAPAGARSAIGFASATVGVAVGAAGSILRTTDGGMTWQPVPSPTASYLYKVSFAGPEYGMIVGNSGTLLESVDGGESWTTIPSPTPSALVDLACLAPRHVYVVSRDLRVLEYRADFISTLFSWFDATPRAFGAELRWSVLDDAELESFRLLRNGVVAATLRNDARSFVDESLSPGTRYEYVLIAVDRTGHETQSAPARVTIPEATVELLPNQPNPFNPATTIRFVVPEKMRVTLAVHDVAGRVVAMLLDGTRDGGLHSVTWNAEGVTSGVYFARLRAGKEEVSRKMVLLK